MSQIQQIKRVMKDAMHQEDWETFQQLLVVLNQLEQQQ